MSAVHEGRGGGSTADRRYGPSVVVAGGAALIALALGGQGLLVPAGPSSTGVRVAAALVALAALGVLVRLDGPARGSRTLTVVAVAGALTGLATLPASPVSLDEPRAVPDPEGGAVDGAGDDRDTVVLDRIGPGAGDGSAGVLVLPPGAALRLDGDAVVIALPDGSATRLGRAGRGGDGGVAPPAGQRSGVTVDGGDGGVVVTRTDGGAIGGDTALGGVAFERGDGTRIVIGEGALLEVPEPIPGEPGDPDDGLDDGVEAILAVLLAAFALVAFAPPIVRATERIVHVVAEPEPPVVAAPPRAEMMEEGLADILRTMLTDPDPRTAVIGAYARLLVALADAGVPRRPEETPHEHLWRTLGPLGVRRAPLHRMAELFVRARFTPRPIAEADRRGAIAALADAMADLRLHDIDIDIDDVVGGDGLATAAGPQPGVDHRSSVAL